MTPNDMEDAIVHTDAHLRLAALTDAPVLAHLHQLCLEQNWQPEAFARLLSLPGALGVLAQRRQTDPMPVAYCMAIPAGDVADLVAIGVVPEMRRQGLARALIAFLLTHLRSTTDKRPDNTIISGPEALMLEVNIHNNAAINFYEKTGFRTVGRRKNYYKQDGHRADAMVMRLDI